MKPLVKYITLLIISGVIIPLYQPACNLKAEPSHVAFVLDTTINQYNFSFIADVASKLLPVLNIFK